MPTASAITRFQSLKSSSERSRFRKDFAKKLEQEQMVEDREAVKMSEEHKQILLSSFESVKTVFSDLDGLSWSEHLSFEGSTPRDASFGRCQTSPFEVTNSRNSSPLLEYNAKSVVSRLASVTKVQSELKSRNSPGRGSSNLTVIPVHVEYDGENQMPSSPNTVASVGLGLGQLSISSEDTARGLDSQQGQSDYPYQQLPTAPTSPTPLPLPAYAAGSNLFRCPSSGLQNSDVKGAVGTGSRLPSISGLPISSDPRSPQSMMLRPASDALGLGLPTMESLSIDAGVTMRNLHSFDRDIDAILGQNLKPAPTPYSSPAMPKCSSPLAQWTSPRSSNMSFAAPPTQADFDLSSLQTSFLPDSFPLGTTISQWIGMYEPSTSQNEDREIIYQTGNGLPFEHPTAGLPMSFGTLPSGGSVSAYFASQLYQSSHPAASSSWSISVECSLTPEPHC